MKGRKLFRERVSPRIWKWVVRQGIKSLGYNKNNFGGLEDYVNIEGRIIPARIYRTFWGGFVEIGNKIYLEMIEQKGKLEQAISDLEKFNESSGYSTDQGNFRKKKDGLEVQTGEFVLSRKLSVDPVIAVIEFAELHNKYVEFLNKYLEDGK